MYNQLFINRVCEINEHKSLTVFIIFENYRYRKYVGWFGHYIYKFATFENYRFQKYVGWFGHYVSYFRKLSFSEVCWFVQSLCL